MYYQKRAQERERTRAKKRDQFLWSRGISGITDKKADTLKSARAARPVENSFRRREIYRETEERTRERDSEI